MSSTADSAEHGGRASARYLRGMLDVVGALQSADDEQAAVAGILPALCAHLDWNGAALWIVGDPSNVGDSSNTSGASNAGGESNAGDAKNTSDARNSTDESAIGNLVCVDFWDAGLTPDSDLKSATAGVWLHIGEGFAGRCWQEARPISLSGADVPVTWPRRALLSQMGHLMAFPLLGRGREVLGVVELFEHRTAAAHAEHHDPDERAELDTVLDAIGQQTGMFIERLRAEQARRRSEDEREELLARMQLAERRQRFLLDAARAMTSAASYAEALEALAALAVPTLGHICLIDVVEESGGIVRMAARHADPILQPLVDELGRRFPPEPGGEHPSVEVIRTGRSAAADSMPEEFMRATTRSEEHFRLTARLGFSSFMSVPLLAGAGVLGSITLISTDAERQIGADDLEVAEALAAQVSEVVATARRYEQEHELAHTLQASLLPLSLPEIEGYALAVRYVPGTTGAEVGGDWYDVVQLASGRTAVTVGDVSGHDVGAASAMGQVRSACRALAAHADSPLALLDGLHGAWDRLGIDRMATLVVAELDRATGNLRIATAGHPPPLMISGSGGAELIEVRPGSPLGAPPILGAEWSGTLLPGDLLMLYTDGLVETPTRPLTEGLERLCSLASAGGEAGTGTGEAGTGTREAGTGEGSGRAGSAMSPNELTNRVLQVLGAERSDDIALLALQRTAGMQRLVLEPELWAPGLARRWARAALAPYPDEQREAAELLLTELVTNAVLHARSRIDVAMVEATGKLRIEVADRSAVVPAKKPYDPHANTGRGIPLLEALADDWGSVEVPGGKVVWFEVGGQAGRENGRNAPGSARQRTGQASTPVDLRAWGDLAGSAEAGAEAGAADSGPAAEPSGELTPVAIRQLPLDLLRATNEWGDALMREFRLIAGREAQTGQPGERPRAERRSVPARLVELIAEMEKRYAPMSNGQDRAIREALESGERLMDLDYDLPSQVGEAAADLQALLDESDGYCKAAQLLTLEEPRAVRAFRTWFLLEFSRQLAGDPPVSWPESAEAQSI